MLRLLRFELKKLIKMKSLYICILTSMVIVVIYAFINKITAEAQEIEIIKEVFINQFTTNGLIPIILGIFTAIYVTDDYYNHTIKNIFARGYSRGMVFFSKYIISTLTALLFSFASLGASILLANILFTKSIEVTTLIESIGLQMLIVLAYNTIFFSISIGIGKIGPSIAGAIVGPTMITLLVTLFDSFFKLEKFKLESYWLDGIITQLQIIPFDNNLLLTTIIVSASTITIFLLLGGLIHKRKQV